MQFSLAALKDWLLTQDPGRLEPRILALRANAPITALIGAAIVIVAALLSLGKFPGIALGTATMISLAILAWQGSAQHKQVGETELDGSAMARSEKMAALWMLLPFVFVGLITATGDFFAPDAQFALTLLALIGPLALLRPLSRSPLIFLAAFVPMYAGAIVSAVRLPNVVSPLLVAGLAVVALLVADQVIRSLRTSDETSKAKNRERSLMSQQLALFSTSQLGIAQSVNGKLGRANARFRQWFGEGTGDALMSELASSTGMTRERLQKLMDRADSRVEGQQSRTVNVLLSGSTPRFFCVQVRRFDPNNRGRGLLWTVSDQTSDWLRRQASERAASRDPLTGALNRRTLHKRITTMLARDLRRQPFAVLCVDINRFGELNRANGEGFGDQILCIVARRLQRILREQDIIARTGGNEFVLVLDNVSNLERASQIAEKVMETLSSPIVLTSLTSTIAASVGIAVAPLHGRRTDEILGRARSSMFAIKRTLVQVQGGKLGRRSE